MLSKYLKLTPFRNLIAIDLRSLALFRMCLAIMLIVDLLVRLSDLQAHYTDWGVLPRAVAMDHSWIGSWSLHFMTGSRIGIALMMGLQLFAAFLLLIGYRTRIMSILCCVLIVSLQARNPMILSGADDTIRLLCIFSMFLPLGAYFSVDRALDPEPEDSQTVLSSVSSFAILAQVSILYLFTFLFKWHPIWIEDNTALYFMFQLDVFTNQFGQYLLEYPNLLRAMTAFFVWCELLCPILLWSPVMTTQTRLLAIFIISSMQIGIASTMGIGMFPFISITALMLFIPSTIWNTGFTLLSNPRRTGMTIYFDEGCDFCKKVLRLLLTFALIPRTLTAPTNTDPEILNTMEQENSWVVRDHENNIHLKFEALSYVLSQSPILFPLGWILGRKIFISVGNRFYDSVASHRPQLSDLLSIFPWKSNPIKHRSFLEICAALLIGWVAIYNISAYDKIQWKIPTSIEWLAPATGTFQNWRLFAPYPNKEDGWYVMPATLRNGDTLDLWRHTTPISWDKPDQVRHDFKNNRWVKYMNNIWMARNEHHRLHFGRYLCRDWNSQHQGGESLETFSIVYMLEKTPDPGDLAEVKRINLWNHSCFGSTAPAGQSTP